MSECVTHHHACDCREARFAAMEAENKALRDAGGRLLAFSRHGLSPVEKAAAEKQMEEALRGGEGVGQ